MIRPRPPRRDERTDEQAASRWHATAEIITEPEQRVLQTDRSHQFPPTDTAGHDTRADGRVALSRWRLSIVPIVLTGGLASVVCLLGVRLVVRSVARRFATTQTTATDTADRQGRLRSSGLLAMLVCVAGTGLIAAAWVLSSRGNLELAAGNIADAPYLNAVIDGDHLRLSARSQADSPRGVADEWSLVGGSDGDDRWHVKRARNDRDLEQRFALLPLRFLVVAAGLTAALLVFGLHVTGAAFRWVRKRFVGSVPGMAHGPYGRLAWCLRLLWFVLAVTVSGWLVLVSAFLSVDCRWPVRLRLETGRTLVALERPVEEWDASLQMGAGFSRVTWKCWPDGSTWEDPTSAWSIALPMGICSAPLLWLGLFCVTWLLHLRRARRLLREDKCERCAYPLKDLPARRCPECGLVSSSIRQQ